MKVVMVASEALPFIKVGGLADVVYSLSKKLASKKINTSVVIPFYRHIKESNLINESGIKLYTSFDIDMAWRHLWCDVYVLKHQNVDYYFIDNEYYYNRDNVYSYDDDMERFAFFNLAASKLIFEKMDNVDIVHVHDWQSGMVPLIHTDKYSNVNTKFMLTIHNPCFQGICSRGDLYNYLNLNEYYFDCGLARMDDCVNFLKTAIMLCDVVTTVSPTHKEELLSGISSYGIERVLPYKGSDFIGIINGLDTKEFNPNTDEYIYHKFNKNNVIKGKKLNKISLCKEFNLENPDYPLISVVGRLATQKGINLILNQLDSILKFKVNLIVLGQGEPLLENQFAFYNDRYSNLSVNICYSNQIAHKIYASSDFLLMPSLFEPCGIAQMIAMRYGTLPIATKVGGLKDTIVGYNHFNEDDATGILFNKDEDDLVNIIYQAISLYDKKRLMSRLIHNAMEKDFSWAKSTEDYIRLYKQILLK